MQPLTTTPVRKSDASPFTWGAWGPERRSGPAAGGRGQSRVGGRLLVPWTPAHTQPPRGAQEWLSLTKSKENLNEDTFQSLGSTSPHSLLSSSTLLLTVLQDNVFTFWKHLRRSWVHETAATSLVIPWPNDLSKLSLCVFILKDLDLAVKFYTSHQYGCDLINSNSY